jgi:hypothetical protein
LTSSGYSVKDKPVADAVAELNRLKALSTDPSTPASVSSTANSPSSSAVSASQHPRAPVDVVRTAENTPAEVTAKIGKQVLFYKTTYL